jgi:hypothetical protein
MMCPVVVVTFFVVVVNGVLIYSTAYFTMIWRRCFLWRNSIVRFIYVSVSLVRQQRTFRLHEKRLLRKIFGP